MTPEPDPATREEPVVDLDMWEKAGRAVVVTVPAETGNHEIATSAE